MGESEGVRDVGRLSHGQRGPIWEIELERGKRLGRKERGEGLEILLVQPESAIRGEGTMTAERDADDAVAEGRVGVGGEKGKGVDTGRPAESKWMWKTGEGIGIVNASKGDGSGGKRNDSGQGREMTGERFGRVLRALLR